MLCPANTKHLHNVEPTSDVVQMLESDSIISATRLHQEMHGSQSGILHVLIPWLIIKTSTF